MQRPGVLGAARQLASKANLDESEIRIVATTVGAEYVLVTFGNDGEAAVLVRRDGSLELLRAPGVDHQATGGHVATVDADVGNASQWSVVANAKCVDLAWSGEYVARGNLANTDALPSRHNLDSEIPVTHEKRLRECLPAL